MAGRMCLVCGLVDVARRGAQTLYCLKCAAVANRRNGAAQAHAAVAREVRSGRLAPARSCLCVDCGGQAMHYDHRDYGRPLDVDPVCCRCNKLRGPAMPLGGVGLFTVKQAKFVTPNWTAATTAA